MLTQRRLALLVGFAVFVSSTLLCHSARISIYPGPGDFIWPLRALRDVLSGHNPYAYPVNPLSIPYPLPAMFAAIPFAWLPDTWAAALFFGVSSGLLAYQLVRLEPAWRLLVFLNPLYLQSLLFAQWSPLIMAMAFFPSLMPLLLIKPHMAAGMAFSGYMRWTRRGLLLTVLLLAISLILQPTWPLVWLSQLGPYQGVAPVMMLSAGGPLLLLALIRWHTREARLFLLMSVAPQRLFYDQMPLCLVPQSLRQMLFLTLASWVGTIIAFPFPSTSYFWLVLFIYWPALLCVLAPLIPRLRGAAGVPIAGTSPDPHTE